MRLKYLSVLPCLFWIAFAVSGSVASAAGPLVPAPGQPSGALSDCIVHPRGRVFLGTLGNVGGRGVEQFELDYFGWWRDK